jgi:hypothetical protein
VLDPTAGNGALLQAFPPQLRYGIEIDRDQVAAGDYTAIGGDLQRVYPLLKLAEQRRGGRLVPEGMPDDASDRREVRGSVRRGSRWRPVRRAVATGQVVGNTHLQLWDLRALERGGQSTICSISPRAIFSATGA